MKTIEDITLILPDDYHDRPRIRFNSDRDYEDHRGQPWTFKAGEVYDGHSVPSLFRGPFPTIDEALIASFIHDQQIQHLGFKDRLRADKDYRKNMRHYGAPWWVCWKKYFGVVIGSIIYTGLK